MFRAHEPGRGGLVAIKVFLDLTPEQSSALVREFEQLVKKGIACPSIAAPIAAGLDEGGTAYLAQEYAVGESLDVVLRDRAPLSVDDALGIVDAVAAAIDRAAERGVHHGLLHPRDVLFSSDGVRVTGFGVAAALVAAGAPAPARPPYTSAGSATDIHALGAIAFELLSGRQFSASNLDEWRVEGGDSMRSAIAAAFAADPHLRPERASVFARGLRAAAARGSDPMTKNVIGSDPVLELSTTMFQSTEPVQDSPSRRWALPAILVVAIAAAAAMAFYLLRSPGVSPTPGKSGVDATTVDLSSQTPEATPAPSPEKPAPPAPASPPPPSLPAPTPSRRASGVVAPAQPRAATTGNLLVRSTPANADVLVNGRARGRTPLALRDLPLGSYTIRVARDGYATEERTFDLTARRPTAAATIVLRAQAQPDAAPGAIAPGGINVQSRPSGARVFVNDRLMGSTPLTIPGLPAGPATVRIEMDGYQTWATTVQVGAREPIRVAASLDRR